MTEIDKILSERGERYGDFDQLANLSQNLKRTMRDHGGWLNLDDDMRVSHNIVHLHCDSTRRRPARGIYSRLLTVCNCRVFDQIPSHPVHRRRRWIATE